MLRSHRLVPHVQGEADAGERRLDEADGRRTSARLEAPQGSLGDMPERRSAPETTMSENNPDRKDGQGRLLGPKNPQEYAAWRRNRDRLIATRDG
jgi:hypothetical protein